MILRTAILLSVTAFHFAASARASEAERPNVLLIVSEDNGAELGCYGDPYVKTPHLDTLADEGARLHLR